MSKVSGILTYGLSTSLGKRIVKKVVKYTIITGFCVVGLPIITSTFGTPGLILSTATMLYIKS